MTISVCIASRGRPLLLQQTVRTLCAGMTLFDTFISIALDQDDKNMEAVWTPAFMAPWNNRIRVSVAPREDSLGAKYNRAQRAVAADLYVLWADDIIMPDKGWDAKLAAAAAHFPDQCGIVLFGQIPGVLQPGLAMTQKFIDAQGFFNVPYFPFWWGETWPLEIATMAGCYVHADVRVELLQPIKGGSRGVREILFWAELFDRLRSSRRAVAEKIINDRNFLSPKQKAALFTDIPRLEQLWLVSNSVLRDPVRAAELEKHYAFDNDPDERYLRLKAKAETMLAELI